jgi:hypothetical protein
MDGMEVIINPMMNIYIKPVLLSDISHYSGKWLG